MPSKYPVLEPEIIIRVLQKEYGYRFVSQKGSHRKYTDGSHTVIIPMHSEVAKGTLRSILQMAEIPIDDFLSRY